MDYIFESMMTQYDEVVVNEYCYGESYYTEAQKEGLLDKIIDFVSKLCEKIMNKIKELINKIAGKEIFVKVPKAMKDHVEATKSWFELFKKAVASIKNGVFTAIKEIIELMKKHPLMTGAIVATGGFVLVKSGVYKGWISTLGTIGGRVRDGLKFMVGKKDMVDKDLYDAAIQTCKASQTVLSKTEADLRACQLENIKKDETISDITYDNRMKDIKIDKQKKRINEVSKIASDRRVAGNKMKNTIKDQEYMLDVSKKSIENLGMDKEHLTNALDRYQRLSTDNMNSYRDRKIIDDKYTSRPAGVKDNDKLWDDFVNSGKYSSAKGVIRDVRSAGKEISDKDYLKKAFNEFKASKRR